MEGRERGGREWGKEEKEGERERCYRDHEKTKIKRKGKQGYRLKFQTS